MHQLTGRTAVVTGAGRGLGQRVAIGLARCGAKIAVVARTAAQVDETKKLIRDAGGEAIGVALDVSDPAAIDRLKQQVHRELGPATILVNAAGVFGPIQLVVDSNVERWIETIQINTIGPYLTCQAFVGDMIAARWGRIINFSSAAALHTPGPLNSAYGVSKVALNQFTRHLAAEVREHGVTVNAIHPGEVKTEMWAAIRDESKPLGPIADGYRQWVDNVGKSGGDDPQKAVDLVLEIIRNDDPDQTGRFLWIKNGIQTPIASW